MVTKQPSSLQEIVNAAKRSHTTIEDMVGNFIRDAITAGVFKPGERLPQDRIAEILGVSRMPVRASMKQLEAEGLVELRPYRGAIVRQLTPDEVNEIYELRIHLEIYALRKVIERITDSQIAELETMASRMDAEGNPSQWFDTRQEFYNYLYQIAGRPRLSQLISNLRAEIGRFWMMVRVVDDPDGHRDLVKAIKQRDEQAAVQWMETHLTTVCEKLQSLMAERQMIIDDVEDDRERAW